MAMDDVVIREFEPSRKGVYAARDFAKGETVIVYELRNLSFAEYTELPEDERYYTHTVNGQIVLYPEPARHVVHSEDPNVVNDHARHADIALRDIRAGELIMVDARDDDVPVLKRTASVLVKVPSIDEGLDFYRMRLGRITRWRTPRTAAVKLGDAEVVLSTELDPRTDILVESVPHAVAVFVDSGGTVVIEPEHTDVGMAAVVRDPFGNTITVVDLSKGPYLTTESHEVIGIE